MGVFYGNSYYTVVDGPKCNEAEKIPTILGERFVDFSSSSEDKFIKNNIFYTDLGDCSTNFDAVATSLEARTGK